MQTIIGQYRENRHISAIINEILFETKYRVIFRDVYCFSCREISPTPVRYFVAAQRNLVAAKRNIVPTQRNINEKSFSINEKFSESTKYRCHSLWPFNLSHVEVRLQLNSLEIKEVTIVIHRGQNSKVWRE